MDERWLAHLVASRAQTLEDVAAAGLSTVAILSGDAAPDPVLDALAADALERGFAIATCSLADGGLHDLDVVVGKLASSLRLPGTDPGRRHGLVVALDAFVAKHKKHAEERFEALAEEEALAGELRVLASQYLAAATGRTEARRLHAWLGGKEVPTELAMRPLAARTAKRALAQLTRLARVLGARGTRVVLRDAEALVDLSGGRRDVAYTVLRELVDNADGGRGTVATEILVVGSGALDRRAHSLTEHPALASRIAPVLPPGLPVPHQSWLSLEPPVDIDRDAPSVRAIEGKRAGAMRALVRVAQGLPPLEAIAELTVGMDEVDARIEQLFAHASNDGSVFAVLVGEYGAGKTHHLLHMEARALADQRPVLRLAVERLDEDLGNPQRHLRRLIENAALPLRRRATPIDRLEGWLRTPATRKRLRASLDAIAQGDSDAARAAERCLRGAEAGELEDAAVMETLGALDLETKPGNPSYRKDAYGRLLLWLDLLARLEGCEGPVLILDEAENLYRAGVSRAERRTALRSLGFYCGGALPRACVVLAVTPDTLGALREEAAELLDQIEAQSTLLPTEDVAMLRRRLLRARPIPVTKLGREGLATLAEQAHRLAKDVHGKRVERARDEDTIAKVVREARTPRELLRRVVMQGERAAWLGE
ncbi:BREX system ATP-binding domain-containing protein [Sandaracinus amylolyticus]|uniref:BREX system ATP-binding domain-containing protein n=1 Tax=Sandaracinus amylolyticus TaxID=927083 RepID=UPI001F24D1D6|nr:BREX system ATP-binding domain-containing protein [Sandaracinus amylolyticus]UJR87080.1 Hypothetical protein I5071_91810 [Sandaracinus amylolyticus]